MYLCRKHSSIVELLDERVLVRDPSIPVLAKPSQKYGTTQGADRDSERAQALRCRRRERLRSTRTYVQYIVS